MEAFAPLVTGIVAALGGGALSNLRTFSTRVRLTRSIQRTTELLALPDLTHAEKAALREGRQMDMFRWSALSTVKVGSARYFVILAGFLITTVVVAKLPILNADVSSPWAAFYPTLAGIAIAAGLSVAAGQFLLLEREREVRRLKTMTAGGPEVAPKSTAFPVVAGERTSELGEMHQPSPGALEPRTRGIVERDASPVISVRSS